MACSTRVFDDPVVSLAVSIAFIFLWRLICEHTFQLLPYLQNTWTYANNF